MKAAPSLLMLALLAAPANAGEWKCPESLRGAAEAHREAMQAEERRVRDSSPSSPRRVEPTEIFDLAAHECHSGRAQMWRVFLDPSCSPAEKPGVWAVTYPYDLRYRRGRTEEAMFAEQWKEGSDGLWRVTFEETAGYWTLLGQREVLDLTDPKGRSHGKPK